MGGEEGGRTLFVLSQLRVGHMSVGHMSVGREGTSAKGRARCRWDHREHNNVQQLRLHVRRRVPPLSIVNPDPIFPQPYGSLSNFSCMPEDPSILPFNHYPRACILPSPYSAASIPLPLMAASITPSHPPHLIRRPAQLLLDPPPSPPSPYTEACPAPAAPPGPRSCAQSHAWQSHTSWPGATPPCVALRAQRRPRRLRGT